MKQLLIHVPLSLNNFMMDNKSEKLGFNASSHIRTMHFETDRT